MTTSKTQWLTGLAILASLMVMSVFLASNRIYQVDEAQNIFMTQVAASGNPQESFTSALLYCFGPMGWLSRLGYDAATLFQAHRLLFLGVFWLNTLLISLLTPFRPGSRAWLAALLGAATLSPMWDYGFEVRHDNLLLFGLLLVWWLLRPRRDAGVVRFLIAGAVCAALPFLAFKAILYVVPLAAAALAFPHPHFKSPAWRLRVAWITAALTMLVFLRVLYGLTGLWPVFLEGLGLGASASMEFSRFWPWDTLARLLSQTPLLLALSSAFLVGWILSLRAHGATRIGWDSALPEGAALAISLGILVANPTPFPYNLVLLVPFLYLAACRLISDLRDAAARPLLGAGLGILVFSHAIPFASTTARHFDWPNDRQVFLMRTAEAMTDPKRDRVFDAIGMVPTRKSIGYRWYLHSLNMSVYGTERWPSVSTMLAQAPASVLIRSYRTEWLPKEDQEFIQTHYIPLADDFWVLGQVLPAGGGPWTCPHAGRYQVMAFQEGKVASARGIRLAGQPIQEEVVTLVPGEHMFEAPAGIRPVVAWLGPNLASLPHMLRGDRARLFVNWY